MTREEAMYLLNNLRSVAEGKEDEAIDMAIEALTEVQKHEETFEWCHDCKEYDKDNYCCHRWSKVIRNTVEELKTYRPTGEWVEVEDYNGDVHYKCDQCGEEWTFPFGTPIENNANYCPCCGAKMERGDADEG